MGNKKMKTNKYKDSIGVLKFFCKMGWKTQKKYFLYYIIGIIINAIGPFFTVIGTRYLMDEIAYDGNKNVIRIIIYTGIIVVGDFLYKTISKFADDKQNVCADRIDRQITMNIDDVSMKIRFEDTENPDVLNQMQKAINGHSQVGFRGITSTVATIIDSVLILVGVVYLVIRCSIVLLLVVIINFILTSYLNRKVAKINYEYFPKVIDKERGFDYVCNKLPSFQFGKDIRLYEADKMIIKREQTLANDMVKNQKDKYEDIWKIRKWYQILDNTLTGLVYGMLAVEAMFARISIGEFSSLIVAVNNFTYSLDDIVNSIFALQNNTKILNETIKYFEMVEYDSEGVLPKMHGNVTIEFKNVSFRYPRSKEYILKDINVKIKNGEHIAVVGENGAGKTTFIKLICRLYKVDEGEILLNGRNINEYKFDEYIKLLSVVFQDFRLLAFTFRDNISFGASKSEDDKIMKLCEIGGISEKILKTEKRLDTSIYKIFETDGIEPSGGEAQKIAIVRALYKNAPLVILDEPTAALDPISEYEIYSHFNNLVENKTAFYISHRLSSCKFCDRIIVFSNNTIMEEGTHEELLMRKNGIYANMYNTQAQYYK